MVKEEHLEPEQMRKLFIGGLDYHTTDESLKAYFEQFGDIVDVVVMKDPKTKRSRGFGFVAFSHSYMVDEAQKNRPHKIDGRSVDTKRAIPRDEINRPETAMTVKKLFVGGLKENVDEEDLRDAFCQFGEVVNVSIPTEKESQKKRGFAFVEFADSDAVDKACIHKEVLIHNKRVDIKKALNKSEMQMQRGGRGGGGGGGSGGGPWASRNDSWGGNQNSGWSGESRNSWGGNQGGYGGQQGGYNQGGYGGQQQWQGSSQGGGNQGWGGQGNQGWGGQQSGYGGGGGGGGGFGNQQGGNWGQPSDFGNNYGQSYGGGPMRNQGYGGPNSRTAPYGGSGGGGGGGYNMGGYESSGGGGRRY